MNKLSKSFCETNISVFGTLVCGASAWQKLTKMIAIFQMDVEYFPFDEQTCVMKFGSWTYDGFQVLIKCTYLICCSFASSLREDISHRNLRFFGIMIFIDWTKYYLAHKRIQMTLHSPEKIGCSRWIWDTRMKSTTPAWPTTLIRTRSTSSMTMFIRILSVSLQ